MCTTLLWSIHSVLFCGVFTGCNSNSREEHDVLSVEEGSKNTVHKTDPLLW